MTELEREAYERGKDAGMREFQLILKELALENVEAEEKALKRKKQAIKENIADLKRLISEHGDV